MKRSVAAAKLFVVYFACVNISCEPVKGLTDGQDACCLSL
jgi:hypothetical protein